MAENRLTVGERIILHLSAFTAVRDEYSVPVDVTQDGIGAALGISRAHAAIELKRLKDLDLVMERVVHVDRESARRKCFFLTDQGATNVSSIKTRGLRFGPIEAQIYHPAVSKTAQWKRVSIATELEDLRRRVAVLESKGA